jgi:hypothetical protein
LWDTDKKRALRLSAFPGCHDGLTGRLTVRRKPWLDYFFSRLYHLTSRLNMALNLLAEQQVAIAAVKRACALTTSVFNKLVKNETLVKGDKSPVTGSSSLPFSLSVL